MLDHGFLGTSAPFIFDFVIVALIGVLPLLAFSVAQAKKKNYATHRKLQILISILLLFTVGFFEVELRRRGGIYAIIPEDRQTTSFAWLLGIHLFFSITTLFIWLWTLVAALIKFKNGWDENYMPQHRTLAKLSSLDLFLTGITGLGVYLMAFV